MATYLAFHAHPDDEAIATGGTMALASRAGHRVVLVVATRGECGEVAPGVLDDGESLGDRRERETCAAAAILGAHRVEFLGYRDSGMLGAATNDDPACFWQADVDEAGSRLAQILRDEAVDAISVYDDHGGYGHPDHVQVHRVGHRAAELAGTPRVYEATMNRDHIVALRAEMAEPGADDGPDIDEEQFGSPDELITTAVDVTSVVATKRAAMAAHASQITDDSFFLTLDDQRFAAAFGTEWFIRTDRAPDTREAWILEGPAPA